MGRKGAVSKIRNGKRVTNHTAISPTPGENKEGSHGLELDRRGRKTMYAQKGK